MCELEALLARGADLGVWCDVWHVLPEDKFPDACLLIVSLVLRAMAGWQARVLRKTESFPLILLRVLSAPQDQLDENRAVIAQRLLRADEME
eukprot:2602826-Pyramimonas_sp.AAC.1